MNGEELYARYCAALKKHWPSRAGSYYAIFSEPKQPPTPKAWTFLTDLEQRAWNTLADVLAEDHVEW